MQNFAVNPNSDVVKSPREEECHYIIVLWFFNFYEVTVLPFPHKSPTHGLTIEVCVFVQLNSKLFSVHINDKSPTIEIWKRPAVRGMSYEQIIVKFSCHFISLRNVLESWSIVCRVAQFRKLGIQHVAE